jgi:hypothetical protein
LKQLAALVSKKKAHAIEQAEMAKLLVAAEEKQQRENKLLATLEAQLAGLSLHSDMEKNLGSIESFCCVHEEKKRELGETRVERRALFAKSSDLLGSKLTAVKASCDISTRAIMQQKEIQLEIEAKKAVNNEVEFTKIVKGRVEFEETSKVKEKLFKLTNNFAQEHESLFKILGLLQEEQSIVLKEIDEKHACLQEPKRILDEHNVEFTKYYEAELALLASCDISTRAILRLNHLRVTSSRNSISCVEVVVLDVSSASMGCCPNNSGKWWLDKQMELGLQT